MRNKKLINRRNNITQRWQFCSPQYHLGKEGEKRKKVLTTRGVRIWSPIQVLTPPNMLLSLWYSDYAERFFN